MTNVLRNVVSKQRIRYKEKGFNLDLAYISDKIIAMGYPADNLESFYRNPLEDVYKFLEENHRDHYKIYNLCLERSYDINKFHGRVAVYPFEDHNPPTIELILKFCEDLDLWLRADILNVAAVHCKAGKGRTGTMICCYLLYSGQQGTAENALACYDEKRTKDRKGVTIPSQRRYVQYFSSLVRSGLPYERRTLQLCEIRFTEASQLQSQGTAHCSISVLQDTPCAVRVQPLQHFIVDFRKTCTLDIRSANVFVAGDTKIELTHKTKKYFHLWFNTFFVCECAAAEGEGDDTMFVYTLSKCEIDDVHKDKEHKYYPEDFKIQLVFALAVGGRALAEDDGQRVGNHSSSSSGGGNQHESQSVRLLPNNQPRLTLPPNRSSGSDLNYIGDQKSSSSASISSLGFVMVGADSSAVGEPSEHGACAYCLPANANARTHMHTAHPHLQEHSYAGQMHGGAPQQQSQGAPPPLPLSPPPSYAHFNEMDARTSSARPLQRQLQHRQQHNHFQIHYEKLPTATTSTPNQRKHQPHRGLPAAVVGVRTAAEVEHVYQCQKESRKPQQDLLRRQQSEQQQYQPSVSVVLTTANNSSMEHATSGCAGSDVAGMDREPDASLRADRKDSNNSSRSNKSSSIGSHSSASASAFASMSASAYNSGARADINNIHPEDSTCDCDDNGDEVRCVAAGRVDDEYDEEDWESAPAAVRTADSNPVSVTTRVPGHAANLNHCRYKNIDQNQPTQQQHQHFHNYNDLHQEVCQNACIISSRMNIRKSRTPQAPKAVLL